jgi:DtxR family Mn-dependent transcriptional regulator
MIDPKLALLSFFGLLLVGWIAYKSQSLIHAFRPKTLKQKTLVEDILKLLYHVDAGKRNVGFDALVGALAIPQKKLLELIQQMSEEGLIRLANENIQLTDEGRKYAVHIVRIHRLWEKYLSEKTGVDKSEWHALAEKKEHLLSAEQADKLYEELGRPRFDPHGDPIPTESGEVVEMVGIPMSSLEAGTIAKIVHIEDEPKVVYDQIIAKKLHMGSQVHILSSDDQAVRFLSEGTEYSLSLIIACNISVRELNQAEIYEEANVRLSALEEGETGTVVGISSDCRGASRRRLLDLGFVKGTAIRAELDSPLKNPRAYLIKNTLIALRKDQADYVLITKEQTNGSTR